MLILLSEIIYIPIGSYEQHGPHLPPNTDYLIARRISEQISSFFKGELHEGIKIGISSEHEGFKDTKSISQEQLKLQIDEIISGFKKNKKFILINSHGGNNDALNSIQESNNNILLVINTFSLIKEDLIRIRTSEIGGICHAGEYETSLMLYLYPKLVKMHELKKSDVKYVPTIDPNYEKEKIKNWKTITLSKSGVLGDPYHATQKKGEIWFITLIEIIKVRIKEFISE